MRPVISFSSFSSVIVCICECCALCVVTFYEELYEYGKPMKLGSKKKRSNTRHLIMYTLSSKYESMDGQLVIVCFVINVEKCSIVAVVGGKLVYLSFGGRPAAQKGKGGTKLSRPHKLFTRFLHTHALWSWEEDPFITAAVLSCRGSSWFRGFSSFLSRNHPWQQHKMLRAHQQGGHSGSMPRCCSCFSRSEKNTRIRHNLIRHLVEQQVSTGAGILSETDQARSAFKSKLTDFDGRSFQMPPTTTFRLAYCLRVVLYHVFVHSTG